VTPSLLASHKDASKGDQWTAINGRVYNLTPYAKFHPGGIKELMRCAGRDGTKLFSGSSLACGSLRMQRRAANAPRFRLPGAVASVATHAWVNPEFMMEGCLVGMMVGE
jgi:cytochrome b involved in lipid metabolism